jgi:hypothetical protein
MNAFRNAVWKALAVAGFAAAAIPAVAAVRMPSEQYDGSVGYVSGGNSRAQARMFERQISRHPLAIELVQRAPRGTESTSYAWVRIADNRGRTVLDTLSRGQFMLVDLAPGRYKVIATLHGETLRKAALVPAGAEGVRTVFDFPTETGG